MVDLPTTEIIEPFYIVLTGVILTTTVAILGRLMFCKREKRCN